MTKKKQVCFGFFVLQSCPSRRTLLCRISRNLDVLLADRPSTAEVCKPTALKARGPGAEPSGQEPAEAPPGRGGGVCKGSAAGLEPPPEGAGGRRLVPAPAPVPVPVPGPGPGEGAETLSQRRGAAGEGRGGPGGAPSPGGAREGSGPRPPGRRAGRCPPWPLLISPV